MLHAFVADATDAASCREGLRDLQPDIVLTDVPYGQQTHWKSEGDLTLLLKSIGDIVRPGGVLGLVTPNRARLPMLDGWERAGTWGIGKRRLWVLRAGTREGR